MMGSALAAHRRAWWRLPLAGAALIALCLAIGAAISAGPKAAVAAVGAVAAVIFVVAVERRPELGVGAAVATMPFAQHPWWEPNITVSDLIVVLTFLVWLSTWAGWRRQAVRATPAFGVYGLFVLAAGTSLLFTRNPGEGLVNLIELVFFALLYVLVLNTIDTPAKVWWVIGAWLVGASIGASYGLYHYALGTSTTDFLAMNSRRIVGTHMDPNFFGAMLGSTIVLCLALWSRARQPVGRLAATAGLAICSTALVLTLSRGAMAGAGAGLVTLLVLAPRRWRFALAVGCAVLAAWAMGLPDYKSEHSVWTLRERMERVASSGDPNRVNRLHGLYIAAVVFSHHPVLGSGLETFREQMAPFSSRFSLPAIYSCHTVPALILAETGAIGFVLFNAFLVVLFIGILRRARASPSTETGVLARHLSAVLVALIVIGLTIDILYSRFVWLAFALADGLAAASLGSQAGDQSALEGRS